MGPVGGEVIPGPDQGVAFAALDAIGPEIRSPEEQRRFSLALDRIEVKRGVTLDLFLNQPASDEPRFVV